MKINTRIAIVAALFTVLAIGASFAQPATTCPEGHPSTSDLMKDFATQPSRIIARELTKEEVQKVVDSKGTPPSAVEGGGELGGILALTDAAGVIVITQNGCFINTLGPAAKFSILRILGLDEAGNI